MLLSIGAAQLKQQENRMAKSLRKRQAKLNARRNAHAATLKSVKDPAAYKQPGSMKRAS